jgi:hypothetical protein
LINIHTGSIAKSIWIQAIPIHLMEIDKMTSVFSSRSKSFNYMWITAIIAFLLIAPGGAWSSVTPDELRAKLLEQQPLMPEEITLYDMNSDGVVDIADLRWLAITSQEKAEDAWLRGQLIGSASNTLVKNATITLKQNGQILASQLDQMGSYRFEELTAGDYEIEVVEHSGIYTPASATVTLDSGENIKDINLTQVRNLVLEAKVWYDSHMAGEQPTFPPEQELFDLVFVLYGTDVAQGISDSSLDSAYSDAYQAISASVSIAFCTDLMLGSIDPINYGDQAFQSHLWLRANIDPSQFASLRTQADYLYQKALYNDLIDNLLIDPEWHEAWLIQSATFTDTLTRSWRQRVLGSLISQYYAPRGRLGPTGLYIVWQLQLYEDVPREFEHWNRYYPQELLLELLGNEMGPDAQTLLTTSWNAYRTDAPDTGPGSVGELDDDGLKTAMSQIDATKELENAQYLAWLLEGQMGDPPPRQMDIVSFLRELGLIASASAPWDLYVAYIESTSEFMSSTVPILPATPDADTLAIQMIFDAYRWVRSATPGSDGGDLNQPGLKTRIEDFADLYIRAFGVTVDSRDIFGEDSLPGVDTPYNQRSAVFSASPELWETWHDSYADSRDANLVALWSLSATPTGALVTGTHMLSPSQWQDTVLVLNSFQQRFAHLAMAYYLYEYANLEHQRILFDAQPEPLGPGLPPNPSSRMKELVKWYTTALTLATQAHGGDNWTEGGLAVVDVRLYAFLQNETEILLAKLTQALELTTQGLDPWGLLKRPFSTVEPDRLKEILQNTIAKWEEWQQADHDAEILNFEVERTSHMSQAANFDVLATQYARDAGRQRLEQAMAMRDIESLRLQLADMQIQRATYHMQAAELYTQAQDGQISVQELKHGIAENKHEMLKKQAEVLKEQLDKVHDNVVAAMESAVPVLRDANATVTELIDQYHDAFQKAQKSRPWWKRLFDHVKKTVGDISEAVVGINMWERMEDMIDMGRALVTGDFDSVMQLWGKVTKENINSPLLKKAVQEGVKAKFKFEISDEQMDDITEGMGDVIDTIVPQDTEELRQYLIAEFLFDATDAPSLANDLMSNLFAERLVDLGVGYALVDDELALFVQGYGLIADQTTLETLAGNLRISSTNFLKVEFPSDSAVIDTAMADLASCTEIISISNTLERRLFRSVVARNTDPNEVVFSFIELRNGVLKSMAEGLSPLSGWDTEKANGLGDAWKDFVKQRAMAVIDREAKDSQTLSKSDIMALMPQETLEALNTTVMELRMAQACATYMNNQSGHEQRINDNAKLYANVNTRAQAEANRDAHIQAFKTNLLGLAESLNTAQAEAVKVQNELIKIGRGAYEQQLSTMVEEKMIGVEQDFAGAKQMELEAAATSAAMAETEREVAAQQVEVAELIITEREAELAGLEQELMAQQARAAAAGAEESRALSEQSFHARAEALNISQSWYWRRMSRNTAKEIIFRGMFDFARTVDLLRGTDLLTVLETIDVQSPEQAQVALEIFELMLYKDEVAQVYNIILSEADTTPGAVVASVALGADPPPEAGLITGGFNEAEILPARDGKQWLVWQLELLDGPGDLPEHFHPGMRNASTRDYHQLPATLMAGFKRIQIPVTGAGERKVFRALSVQPKIDSAPGPFNTDVHLVHLGDMWMNAQASSTGDFALQWNAVAPVEFSPDGEYRLPASHTAFDIDFTNNQLYLALRPDPDPNARELASSDDYGANYPILGTWWIMAQKDYFQANVHLRITFYAKSVFRLEQETSSAFTNAMNAMDEQVFEDEIKAAGKAAIE